jgi:quercetin dioxygenase-like cupin family protein
VPAIIALNAFRAVGAAAVYALAALPLSVGQRDITHRPLLNSELRDAAGQEVIVTDTEYAPGAAKPRQVHSSTITFRVISGTGVWLVAGRAPVIVTAGETLMVPAGLAYSHRNPSTTEPLRVLAFTVARKGEAASLLGP